jgi:hypothetical protein
MSRSINLKKSITDREGQRAILGDDAIDATLVPNQRKLVELEAMVNIPKLNT